LAAMKAQRRVPGAGTLWVWPGTLVALLVAGLIVGTLGAVLWRAGGVAGLRGSDWAALRFTVLQAVLSAGLSVALAAPVARALARRQFAGRGLLVGLMGAPFVLPVIVAVLGLLAVFGRNGLVNAGLGWVGVPPVGIYGLQGVVLAHVFFNLPLAVRLILQGWVSIPAERFRLAASLGFGPREVFWRLELPMLREVVPGVALAVFLLCLTSFAVALMLGGGPAATTLELAIYQAFRFEFDLERAAVLAMVQFVLCGLASVLALWWVLPSGIGVGLDRRAERWDTDGWGLRALDVAIIGLAALFLLTPLAMVTARGAPYLTGLPGSVWAAAGRSVVLALGSAGLALAMGVALALAAVRFRWLEGVGMLALAASPLVLGTGLFLLLFGWADPVALALPVTGLVNAVMALPFVLRAVLPELRGIEAGHGRLADSLGLVGWSRIRWLILPRLARPLGFAAGLAAALSMGDLGVVALFGDPEAATLPLQVYRLMGAYRMDMAQGAAVLLLALSLGLFWLLDGVARWGRQKHAGP